MRDVRLSLCKIKMCGNTQEAKLKSVGKIKRYRGKVKRFKAKSKSIRAKCNCIALGYYLDDGYSGTNFDRPDFQRMIADMENGRIGTIITKDLSRLGREYLKTGEYIEMIFPDYDVRYIAINDNVDTLKSENEFMAFKTFLMTGSLVTPARR